MKILLASNYAPPHGGVATTVYYLAKYLGLNKQQVTVVSFEKGFENLVGEHHNAPGCKVVKLEGWKVGNDYLFKPRAFWQLISVIKQQDLIFVQTPYFFISNIMAVMAKLQQKKIICLNHGPIYQEWRNRLHLPLINFLIDKWLFLNQENVEFVKKYVKKIKPYEIVKNGIELGQYAKRHTPSEIKKFIFIGRLEKEKGMEEMIQIIQTFPNYEFGFIGEGIYQKKLRVFKNTTLYGFLKKEQMISIMRKYDCLLLPSHYESFGLVILEAIACGLPVIATNTNSNIANLIRDNGIIIPVKDTKSLIEAALKINKKPIVVHSEYLKEFAWSTIINDYLKTIQEVFN